MLSLLILLLLLKQAWKQINQRPVTCEAFALSTAPCVPRASAECEEISWMGVKKPWTLRSCCAGCHVRCLFHQGTHRRVCSRHWRTIRNLEGWSQRLSDCTLAHWQVVMCAVCFIKGPIVAFAVVIGELGATWKADPKDY